MDPHLSRVCNTKESLEELIMDITSHDLNKQIQKLVSNYKKTGREEFKVDARCNLSSSDEEVPDDEDELSMLESVKKGLKTHTLSRSQN